MQISLKVVATLFSLLVTILLPQCSFAFSWQDFWFTKNQQAAKLYSRGEIKKAATQFSNPLWKGVANYHSGQYKKAIDDFSKEDTSLSNYNRGNALTHTANYQQAIAAYNRALKKDPDFKDALYNKKLLEKFLKQQPKKSKQSSKQSKQNNSHTKEKNNQQQKSAARSFTKPSKRPSNSPSTRPSIGRDDNRNKNRNNQSRQNQTNQADQNNQTEPPSSQHQTSQQKKDHTQPQSQQQQKSNNQQEKDNPQNSVSHSQQQKEQQQQQALKQWLQQIPDNPGGLLREKFLRDHWHLQMKGRTHENN